MSASVSVSVFLSLARSLARSRTLCMCVWREQYTSIHPRLALLTGTLKRAADDLWSLLPAPSPLLPPLPFSLSLSLSIFVTEPPCCRLGLSLWLCVACSEGVWWLSRRGVGGGEQAHGGADRSGHVLFRRHRYLALRKRGPTSFLTPI
eukprot:1368063-Rhodomonas_salina.2